MFFYIARRLITVVVMLAVISMVTFGIFFAGPIDPARLTCPKNCTPAVVAANAHALGYDKPVVVQYEEFVKGIVVGRDIPDDPEQKAKAPDTIVHCSAPCLGYSLVQQKPVTTILADGLPITASIAGLAFVLWMVFGVLGGIVAALRRGGILDRTIVGVALIGYSLPTFFIGVLLLVFVSLRFHLLPIPTYTSPASNPAKWLQGLWLPSITLALAFAASYVRLTRAFMLETMSEDYIRTARAKGVPERTVIRRHGLRAALTPIVTQAGVDFGVLLGGAIITERVFNFQGLGFTAVLAVTNADLPVTVALVIVASFFVVMANLIVDVLYGVIDPRVRLA